MSNGPLDVGTVTGAVEFEDNSAAPLKEAAKNVENLENKYHGLDKTVSDVATNTAGFAIGMVKGIAEVAGGMLTADAIGTAIRGTFHALADEIKNVVNIGAGIADVEENFEHLAAGAGMLGKELLTSVQQGTHNTISDFEIMKSVNQDLAAGMNLTATEFGTLSKGAFALAQATGTDVKSAFDKMNDAMLTGRTRGVAMLTGKIDLTKAEEDFAKKLGTTAEHLSAEGKLQAAREAILNKVSEATARLGEQTDGLDESAQQLSVAWENFHDNVLKTIAQSPVLKAGLDEVRNSLKGAFGDDPQALIKAVAKLVDEAAIELISLAEIGATTAGFIVKEYHAAYKIFGDLAQIVSGVAVAFKYASLGVAEFFSIGGKAGPMKDDVKRINDELDKLMGTMVARGKALQEADKAQGEVDAHVQKSTEFLEGLRRKMEEAQKNIGQHTEAVTKTGKAHEEAGKKIGETARYVQQSKQEHAEAERAAKKHADAVEELSDITGGYGKLEEEVGFVVVAAAEADLKAGAAAEKVAEYYGLSSAQVKILNEHIKLHKTLAEEDNKIQVASASILQSLGQNMDQEIIKLQKRLALKQKLLEIDADAQRLNVELLQSMGQMIGANDVISDQQEDAILDSERWRKSLDDLSKAFAQMAQIAGDSFGGVVQDIANVITSLNLAEKAAEQFRQAELRDDKAGMLGAGVAGIGAVGQATGSGSVAGRGIGGALSGFTTGGAIGGMFGPAGAALGAGIGAAVGGLTGIVRGIFDDPEWRKVNDLRDSFQATFGAGEEGLRKMNEAAHEAGMTLDRLLNAKTIEEYKKAQEELNEAIQHHNMLVQQAGSLYGPSRKQLEELAKTAKEVYDYMLESGQYTAEQLAAAFEDSMEAQRRAMGDASQEMADAAEEAGYKTQEQLAMAAEKALKLYEYMRDSGKFTADQIADAFEKAQKAASDAIGMASSEAGKAYDELKAKHESLAQSIADEAPEEVMGVIESNVRAQMATLEDQMERQKQALTSQADDVAAALRHALENLHIDPIHIQAIIDLALGGMEKPEPDDPNYGYSGGLVGGGKLKSYYGTGGFIPAPRGADTILARLRTGERVLTPEQNVALESGALNMGGTSMQDMLRSFSMLQEARDARMLDSLKQAFIYAVHLGKA